jgi:hypothetical protein
VQTTLPVQVWRPRWLLAVLVAAILGLLGLFLTASPARAAAATFKQVKADEIKSGTDISVAFDSPNEAGNLIVVYVAWTNTNTVKVEDDSGSDYVPLDRMTWGLNSDRSSQVFYAKGIVGGANKVRATFATAITSSGWADMYIHEYSGIDKANPFDVTRVSTGTDAKMSSGPATTTNANDLIFGAGASSDSVSQVGTDFTSRSSEFGNRTEDKNVAVAGSHEATATQNVAGNTWVMHVVAFKVDPSAPDKTRPSTPTGLNQTPRSTEQIDLNWTASTDDVGVVGYKVFRNGIQIAAPATPSYSDMSLAPGTTYSYEVSATDAAGNDSPKSTAVTATTFLPPPDTTAPTVALIAPTSGAAISGKIDVKATASDNVGVTGVQFLLDGNPIGPEVTTPLTETGGTAAGKVYSVSWDASKVPNGSHALTARAHDAANNPATSAQINVTVDTLGPKVEITSPANNSQVGDLVKITANASDNVGVESVQFLVDNVDRGAALTNPPYELEWDSRTVTNGMHTLAARARDAAGNPTLSPPITVKVANDTSRCGVATGSGPTATILEPNATTTAVGGEGIAFRGEGTDPDCGPLPGSAFSWTFERVNDGQTSLITTMVGQKNGSFSVPAAASAGFPAFEGNTRYRITLNVVNQQGQKATAFVDIDARKVKLMFNSAPTGLTLYVDDVPRTTPFTIDTLVGFKHNIDARNQTSGGLSYTLESWSDKGAPQHEIVATADQTYTATYTVLPSEPASFGFKQLNYTTVDDSQRTVSTTYTKEQTAGNTNIIAIGWRSDQGDIAQVTDDKGNGYELAAALARGDRLSQAIYYAKNIAAAKPGENTVKVTFTADTLGPDVSIAEYSGVDPTKPVDVTKSNPGSNNVATTGPVTTTAANTLLFVAGISSSSYGEAADDFTTRVLTTPKMGGLASTGIVADRTVDTASTYEATAPVTGGGTWLMQLVAFRGAG